MEILEDYYQCTGIFLGEAQRGSDPEDVAVETAFPDQDAHVYTSTVGHLTLRGRNFPNPILEIPTFHVLHGVTDLFSRRRLQLPVCHELDAKHEPRPPHVADDCSMGMHRYM